MQPQQDLYNFGQPLPKTSVKISDYAGDVAIIILGGIHEVWQTDFGSKPAARVTAVILTGQAAGTVLEDCILYAQTSQVRDMHPGMAKLTRIVEDGKSWKFAEYGAYDNGVAQAWIGSNRQTFDALCSGAVRNFHEKQAAYDRGEIGGKTQQPPSGNGGRPNLPNNAPAPPASPQFAPPVTQSGGPYALHDTGGLVQPPLPLSGAGGQATLDSMRDPGQPAQPSQVGY